MFCVAGIEPQQKCLEVGLRGTSCLEMFDGRLLVSNKATLGSVVGNKNDMILPNIRV